MRREAVTLERHALMIEFDGSDHEPTNRHRLAVDYEVMLLEGNNTEDPSVAFQQEHSMPVVRSAPGHPVQGMSLDVVLDLTLMSIPPIGRAGDAIDVRVASKRTKRVAV